MKQATKAFLLVSILVTLMTVLSGCGPTHRTTTVNVFSHNWSHNRTETTSVDASTNDNDNDDGNGPNPLVLIALGVGVVGGFAYGLGRGNEADKIERALRGE